MSNDLSFASKIGGVLIESGSSFQQKLKGTMPIRILYDSGNLIFVHGINVSFFFSVGLSPDNMFPQAEFSPYGNVEYKWNPTVWYHKLFLNL